MSKKPFAAVKLKKNTLRQKEKNIALANARKTLREKKDNFAWENLRYSNFAFNEQTTCARNLALSTRKKLR
jgi:hypothetical protein